MEFNVAEQYSDLGLGQDYNGQYQDIVIPNLDFETDYAFRVAWIYSDKTKGVSEWSERYNFTTDSESTMLAPHFISTDLYAINSILYINWDGLSSGLVPYDSSILKKVNVWIKGGDYGETYKQVHSFTEAGLHQINATQKTTYCVKLQAESKQDNFSAFSSEFCVTMLKQPKAVYDVRHTWDVSGNLSVFWKFDSTLKDATNDNTMADQFGLQLLDETNNVDGTWWTAVEKDKLPPLEQKITISANQLQKVFGQFTAFEIDYASFIYVRDKNLQTSFVTGYALTKYTDPLIAPVISATAAPMAYNVSYTASSAFDKIYIYESLDGGTTWGLTPYITSSNPAYVPALNTLQRSVRAKFSKKLGGFTAYSNVITATPLAIDPTDTTPPSPAIITSSVWSGNNLSIVATVSADTKKFIIGLTNGGTVGFFTKFPTTSGTSQTVLITEQELYNTLGDYFTSFTGLFVSADSKDNRDSGVSFTISEKNNELNGVVPTFTLTPISNGYSVTYTLPSAAAYAKIYASSTSGFTPNDSTNLVYSGSSPGIIIDPVYTVRYVKIKYLKTDGSTSSISAQQSVTPADPGMLSLIDNEVKISTNGSILAGDSATSGGRGIFNKTGIYFYDTGGTATSQLMANASSGSPTFITTNAKIANWSISSSKIENTLYAGTTQYSGLSPSGTYAFWAGSTTSGGDASANFSVTPAGAVIAKNITIAGGSLSVGNTTISALTGKLTATDADLSGKITANSGSITGNLNITSPGSLIAGTLVGPRVQINSDGLFAYGNILVNNLPVLTQTTQIIGNAATDAPTFITTKALIGNWAVGADSLSAGGITLNSATPSIIATNSSSYVGIKPRQSAGTDIVLWAGNTDTPAINSAASGHAGFQVNANGQMRATGAIISGVVSLESGSSLGGLVPDSSKVYYSGTTPTVPTGGHKVGDSWVDTANGNQLKIWSGTVWVITQDSAAALAVANLKTKTTYGPTQPTNSILGDVWFDTTSGINYFKVYNGTIWVRMKDSDITAAAQSAADALTEANKKSTTTSSTTAPSSPKAGDIWFDTNFNYFKLWSTTVSPAAWVRLKDGDLTTAQADIIAANTKGTDALLKAVKFGVDGSLAANLAVKINDGKAGSIHSSYMSGGAEVAKSSYSSTNPGFFLGWEEAAGVIYPAFNVGNDAAYVKYSNSDQKLRISGDIATATGDYWNRDGSFRFGGATGITKSTTGSITLGANTTIQGTITASSLDTPYTDIDTSGNLTIVNGTKTTTLSNYATLTMSDSSTGWDAGGAINVNSKSSGYYGTEDATMTLGGNRIQLSRSGGSPSVSYQSYIAHADEISGVSRGSLLISSSAGIVLSPSSGSLSGTVLINGKLNPLMGIAANTTIYGSTTWDGKSIRNITVNASAPSGGSEGDIWIQIG